MILKEREKSATHKILESLNNRMEFSSKEKFIYENQLKGLKGEQLFDSYVRQLEDKSLIIKDLTLSHEGKIFQIDLLVIFNNKIYLYEVKNYFGNYMYKDDEIFAESGFRILNPLGQLNRSKTYLAYILEKIGMNVEIEANVAFIHPEFYLYSVPLDKPFIFSPQLPQHFRSLMEQEPINEKRYLKWTKKLIGQNIENYRPDNLPFYDYGFLKKGIYCPKCGSFKSTQTKIFRTCSRCGFREKIHSGMKRNIEEFHLLFPEELITTNKMYDWCNKEYSKRRIRRLLKTEYKPIGLKNGTHYIKSH